jgi:hypothetical protein
MEPKDILRARKKNGQLRDKFIDEARKLGKYLSIDVEDYVMERMANYVPPTRDCKHFGGKAT